MFWYTLFLWAATFVLSDYFRPKLPSQEASGEGDFQAPTSTEGRKVPQVIGGTVKIKGPNTIWQGDWEADPVTVETGVIFKRDETVGYRYKIALALGQFHGECAGMTGIYIGDDKVWDYVEDNGGNVGTVADIDLPELFGGERSGGGFQGRIRCFTGSNSQPVSSFLASRIPLQSAWPGYTYVVLTDLTENSGAVIGESNSMRNLRIEFQMFDTIANGGLGNELSLTGNKHFIGRDANPISCAYRVLNNPNFSIGTSDVNLTNFQTVAETCYNEGLGYSQVVDNETEAYAVLAEIEKHIDGYIGPNPTTGLIEVKLARNDYTPANEYQATTANIRVINNYAKPEWAQTKNEVKIRFVNREKDYSDDHAVAQDMAGRLITGRPQSITIRFPGLRDAAAANRIVARAARGYFWPLAKFEMECDRTAYALRPGDVAIVTHPDINAVELPVRVTRIRTGDPVNQTIKLDVVEDVFADETGIAAAPPASGWVPAAEDPVAITVNTFAQAPKWLLRQYGLEAEKRLLWLVARDNPNNAFNVSYKYRINGGVFGGNFTQDFFDGPFNTFTKYGTIRANSSSPELGLPQLRASSNTGGATTVASGGAMYVDGDLASLIGTYDPTNNGNGLMVINPRAINEEFVAMSSCVADGTGVLVSGLIRGLGDSSIHSHDPGEPVWFIDNGTWLQENVNPDYNQGSMAYAIQPVAPSGEGTLGLLGSEFRFDNDAVRLPNPPTAVIIDQLSTSTWYQLGDIDLSVPNSYTAPSAQGVNFEVWNRKHEQTQPYLAANSQDDQGSSYSNNSFNDRNPVLNVRVYDLDTTPDPDSGFERARTDAIFDTQSGVLDDRVNQFFLNQSDLSSLVGLTSPFNARFEFSWENTSSPAIDGVFAGVESRSVWFDRLVSFNPAEGSYALVEQTLLLLHFEGNDATTQVIDYSLYNHPVTLSGGVEIDRDIPDDDFGSPVLYPEGHLIHPSTSGSPDNICEVTDVSPRAFAQLNSANGFMIQVRVLFTATPSGEIPLVTKWRTSDNERQFWLGLNNTTLRMKWSNDGTSELIETTGTRTWTLNQWYEITATVTDSYVQFFVDGVFDEAEFHAWSDSPHDSQAPIRIGSDGDGNKVAATTHIDEVRILNLPLYQAPWTKLTKPYVGRERRDALLINWENATDGDKAYTSDDLNRYTVRFPGTAVTEIDNAQSKFGTNSLRCSGVNSDTSFDTADGVSIRETGSTGEFADNFDFARRDFTIECQVRLNVSLASHTGGAIALVTKYNRGPFPFVHWYLSLGKSGTVVFLYRPADNSGDISVVSPVVSPLPTTGQWYHVAVCRKDGVVSLFFEGTRVAQNLTDFVNYPMINEHTSNVCLGRLEDNNTSDHWALNGWLDEVRIINGVAAYDGATYTVPTSALPTEPLPPASPTPPPSAFTDNRNPSNWNPRNL